MLSCISRNGEGKIFFISVIVIIRGGRVYCGGEEGVVKGGGEDILAVSGGGWGEQGVRGEVVGVRRGQHI